MLYILLIMIFSCGTSKIDATKENDERRRKPEEHIPEDTIPLIIAINKGDMAMVDELIKSGADLNARNVYSWTPLIMAQESGHMDIFDKLIEAGADLNATDSRGWTALHHAHGRKKFTARLIKAGVKLDAKTNDGSTALMIAAHIGDIDTVIQLIKAGADINSKDNQGLTALASAIRSPELLIRERRGPIIKLLKDAGAK